jgi:putative ABC transport system permease protein
MDWAQRIREWFRALFRKEQLDQEMDEELRFHLEEQTRENIEAGMSPAEARAAALRAFGGVEQVKEACRELRGVGWLETLWQDVRFGLRMLRKNPGFTTVAVLTLGVGLGGSAAIFSLMNAVVLQPLPFREPERLVQILKAAPWHGPFPLVGREELVAWQKDNPVLEQVAAYSPNRANLSGCGEAARIPLIKASAALLPLLGVQPLLGRNLLPEEDRWGGPPVALLTHAFWRQRLGGRRDVLGKTIALDNRSFSVIGVLPAGFRFPGDYDVMVPLAVGALSAREQYRLTGSLDQLQAIGRLKKGVTLEQAGAALDAIYQGARTPEDKGRISVRDLRQQVIGVHDHNLRLLFGLVTFVLLIVCANVANLVLARATGRRREMAIRASLGAGRGRIVRQLLTESVVLSLLGAIFGALAGYWALRLLQPLTAFLPKLRVAGLNGLTLGFVFLVALLTGIVIGLAPALVAAKVSLRAVMSDGGGGAGGSLPGRRLQSVFVVLQVAVAMVLLLGASLLVLSMRKVRRQDPGFDVDRLLSFTLTLSAPRYGEEQTQRAFFQQVLEAIRQVPSVEAASIGLAMPLSQGSGIASLTTTLPGSGNKQVTFSYNIVDAGYFAMLGPAIKRGRGFTPQDRFGTPEVAIVNEAFTRTYLRGQETLGQRIPYGQGALTIVGVAADVQDSPEARAAPLVYLAFPQHASPTMSFLVRTREPPLALLGGIRQIVEKLDSTQPIYDARTMKQRLADINAFERIFLDFSGVFAIVAIVLAALGVYGVMAGAVTQRTSEVGIRMALGARPKDVLALILTEGLLLAGCGAGVGLLGGLGLTQVLIREMYGMSTRNPLVFAGVTAAMMAVALLATWLPARRAAKVDPMVALRYE